MESSAKKIAGEALKTFCQMKFSSRQTGKFWPRGDGRAPLLRSGPMRQRLSEEVIFVKCGTVLSGEAKELLHCIAAIAQEG